MPKLTTLIEHAHTHTHTFMSIIHYYRNKVI